MHPLDLPEIRSVIAQYLTEHDLALCARVSQAWKQTCLPLLWQEFTIIDNDQTRYDKLTTIGKDSFLRHSHLIKTLDNSKNHKYLANYLFSDDSDVQCENLGSLTLYSPIVDQISFIHRHRLTLVDLDLSCQEWTFRSQQDSVDLWQAIASCPSLESLAIAQACVTHSCWSACWLTWTRLTDLRLSNINFSPLHTPLHHEQLCSLSQLLAQKDNCGPPLRIRTLHIYNLRPCAFEDGLALLKHCPDLKTLLWYIPCDKFSTAEQYGQQLAVETRHCPKLVDITLSLGRRNENALIPILKTRTQDWSLPLQRLKFLRCYFDRAAWELVRTMHGWSLRTLELDSAALSDGAIVQDILCSLTGLEKLVARSLPFLGEKLLPDPRPWVCLGLKHLDLEIRLVGQREPPARKMIMGRIGTLKNLRHLELSQSIMHQQCRASFRLVDGLEDLKGLQELRVLELRSMPQELDLKDVQWMMENWPRLHSVTGNLHSNSTTNSLLKSALKKGGVATVRGARSFILAG